MATKKVSNQKAEQKTYFKVGDRCAVWGCEGKVVKVEKSSQPFRRNGFTEEWTKPAGEIEWVTVHFDNPQGGKGRSDGGEDHEYAAWDVAKLGA